MHNNQGCGAGAGAGAEPGAGAAGADAFWSELEPEPPKWFARSEITRNSRTNSLPKFFINNFRRSAMNYLKLS